jgi:hypothetical protein
MDLNFLVRGFLSLALAYGLYLDWPKAPGTARVSLGLIAAWGFGSAILAFSPTDVSGPSTLHGSIHLATAFLAFLFVTVGLLGISYAMPGEVPWRPVRPYAKAIAALTAIALVVLFVGTGIPHVERDLFGLLERVFLGFALLWMLVVSVHLLRSEQRGLEPSTSRG